MKQYKTYLFDLYGTLVDIHTEESKPSFWKSVAAFYREHGADWEAASLRLRYHALCADETARLQTRYPDAEIEIDLLPVFRALYEQKRRTPNAALLAETAWYFRRCSTTHLRAYAGARDLLEALHAAGKTVVLLSNAQSSFTRPELDLLGLTGCFDRIFISSELGFRKPDARFFREALRELGLDPTECLMIGNDPVCDVEGAAGVGMDAVYLHSGLSPKNQPAPVSAVLSLPQMNLRRLRCAILGEQKGESKAIKKPVNEYQ